IYATSLPCGAFMTWGRRGCIVLRRGVGCELLHFARYPVPKRHNLGSSHRLAWADKPVSRLSLDVRPTEAHEAATRQLRPDEWEATDRDSKPLSRRIDRHLNRVDHQTALAVDRLTARSRHPCVPVFGDGRDMNERRIA